MDVITTTRQVLFDIVDEATEVPVYQWLPGEGSEVPCFVVGRPDVDEGESRAVATISVPMYVIGRTAASRDDDTQRELDQLADDLINLMWKPPRVDGPTMRLTRMQATVVPIAAVDYPAYTATIVAATTFC